ncbi:MAG: hypothetical protein KKA05_02125 [Alphaproteobacteria bacterium]|nr:hypothetical protein [Alphaproteobacteria bacterium]MBU0859848.1 hypothetical protein [Alphaproteobacteria bacterium]
MTRPLFTLWHGTSSGPDNTALHSILTGGLSKIFNNPRISGQTPGVYFATDRSYAIERALRCIGKLQRGGQPVLLGIQTDLNPQEWDWDFEVSRAPVADMMRNLKINSFVPQGLIGYKPDDYRHGVSAAEIACHNFRWQNETTYRAQFANATRLLVPDPDRKLAFKYTGYTPLRVQTVELI